jgi:hypothetical protein
MAILSTGDIQTASSQYQQLMNLATQQASKQRQLGGTPAEIWWLIDEATFQLGQLVKLLKSNAASPVKANISNPETIGKSAGEIADLLRARSIALQYNIAESPADSNATIAEPDFVLSTTQDGKYVYRVEMHFSYSGLEPGQLLIFKVYRNGVQDPSWSFNQRWAGTQPEGKVNFTISPTYSSIYIAPPGIYTVDIYVNGQMLQQGEFTVSDPNGAVDELTAEDMLDQFDFYSEDFASSDSEDNGGNYFDDPIFFLDSEADYFAFFNESYDVVQAECTDPNDLTCSTEAVDCTVNPDDPSCEQQTSIVCESNPTLSAEDPECASSTLSVCESDPTLAADDPNCVALEPTDVPTGEPTEEPTEEPIP